MININSKTIKYLSTILFCLLFPHLSPAQVQSVQTYVDTQLKKMTLDQKIGQLFIFGFGETEMNPEFNSFLMRTKPGAFIFFKKNMANLQSAKNFNLALYRTSLDYANVPPLLAVDQEGGNVVRINTVPSIPSALAVGQTDSPEIAEQLGLETGTLLKKIGFNMNLAPVLDVADPFSLSFIGQRSFGSDAGNVAKMSTAYSRGLIRAGILPTAKHFPGTGSVVTDPHKTLPTNSHTLDFIKKNYLPPYKQYATLGPFTSVMISQLIYPSLDDTHAAVFSKNIMTNLLRNQLSYRGLIITDDLQMSSSKNILNSSEASLQSLLAGADLVMLSWSKSEQASAVMHIKNAVLNGKFSRKLLNEKLARILRVKYYLRTINLDKMSTQLADAKIMSSSTLSQLSEKILSLHLKSYKFKTALQNVCVVSSSQDFINSFKSGFTQASQALLLSAKTSSTKITEFINTNHCQEVFFTVLGHSTAQKLNSLSAHTQKMISVINLSLPAYTKQTQNYKAVVNLYFSYDEAGKKIAQLLNQNYAINEN